MKKARIVVLAAALLAGGGAAWLIATPAPAPVQIATPAAPAAPVMDMGDILVAIRDMPMGTVITGDADMQWQNWPTSAMSAMMIKKSDAANAIEEIKGSVTRGGFLQGEPMRRDKLVKGANSGYLSAILPSGMRALAINTDVGGSSSAGGFVLPNDRVDIIRISRDEDASKSRGIEVITSETVVTNVRVLAIAEAVQEENGKKSVKGQNATLELTPQQAELVVASQRMSGGTLSLALRSMLDANKTEPLREKDTAVTVVRYGVPGLAGQR